jgi:alkylation response protein AidB-like acyl-CoA dehydrogenase
MDFELSSDQAALVDAVTVMVGRHAELRKGETLRPMYYSYGDALDRDLMDNGFLDILRSEDFGPLEAGLMIAEVARSPHAVEVVASALVAPSLWPELTLPRPIALARQEDLCRAVRFLDRAATVLVDAGDRIVALPIEAGQVEEANSVYAYPMGRFRAPPDLTQGQVLEGAAILEFRRLWRVGLTLEIAGALRGAVHFTTDYVKARQIFGRPLGSFQAVQHRLAMDVPRAEGAYWTGLRAAWSGLPVDAATALLHAQAAIQAVVFDTHQFNGALGFTLEHALHFWTQRLRWLEAEMGGAHVLAEVAADLAWPDP